MEDDEDVDLVDLVRMRRAQALLDPPMIAPEKCNVSGATDPNDPDADGVPNDCDAADEMALREHLAGLAPGISPVCAPAVGFTP